MKNKRAGRVVVGMFFILGGLVMCMLSMFQAWAIRDDVISVYGYGEMADEVITHQLNDVPLKLLLFGLAYLIVGVFWWVFEVNRQSARS